MIVSLHFGLLVGRKKQLEDVSVGSAELRMASFSHFDIDLWKKIDQLIWKIIDRIITNESNS